MENSIRQFLSAFNKGVAIGLGVLTLSFGAYKCTETLHDAYNTYKRIADIKGWKEIDSFLDVHGNLCGKGDEVRLSKKEIEQRLKDKDAKFANEALRGYSLGGQIHLITQSIDHASSVWVHFSEPKALGDRLGSESYSRLEKGSPIDKDYLDMVRKMVNEYNQSLKGPAL